MQIFKSEQVGDQITLTISTDTVEYEPPLVIQHTIGDEGYTAVSGPLLSEEEGTEAYGLLEDYLRRNGLTTLAGD